MAKRHDVLTDFSGGEVSERATMSLGPEAHRRALSESLNFLVLPQGGAAMRAGFRRVSYNIPGVGEQDAYSGVRRILPLRRGGEEDFILTLASNGAMLVFNQNGFWTTVDDDTGTPIPHPYTEAELEDIEYAQNEVLIILVHPNHPPVYIEAPQDPDPAEPWVANFQDISDTPELRVDDQGAPITTGADWDFFLDPASWQAGDQLTGFLSNESYQGLNAQILDPNGDPLLTTYTANGAVMARRLEWLWSNHPAITRSQVTVVPKTGGPAGTFTVQFTGPNADVWPSVTPLGFPTIMRNWTRTQNAAGVGTSEPAWTYPYTVLHNTKYYGCRRTHTASAADEPGVGANWTNFWTDLGTTAPPAIAYQHGGTAPTWSSGTNYPRWDRGFPSVVTFFQERAVMAATKTQRTTIWGSRIGNYKFFVRGDQDNEPYSFQLATKDTSEIQWMAELQGLAIGSSSGDWLMPESIVPSNPGSPIRITGRRSKQVRPVVVGPELFYVEQGGKKMRRRIRNRDIQGWLSEDFSLWQQHIAERNIKRLAIQYVPETFIWLLLNDQQLACVAYNRETELAAWSRVETPGKIDDMIVQHGVDGQDTVWAIVTFGGDRHLYYMSFPEDVNLDGYQLETIATSPQTFNARAIAVGRPVRALERPPGGDWRYLADTTVDGSGNVTFSGTIGAEIAFGEFYEARLTTLEQVGEGFAFSARRRWTDLYTRLLRSFRPTTQGQVPRDPDTRVSEDMKVNALGYNKGVVTFEQTRSLHTEVVGVYGQLEEGED